MQLGGDFTSGHALCVSVMALSSGANPLESRTWAGVL